MATSPKRSVGRVDRLIGSEEPGPICGAAPERGPHCPVCVHPECPVTEMGEGSVPSPRPCLAPELALQGQSGSDRTGAAYTWLRAVRNSHPGPPKTAFRNSTAKFGSRSKFLLLSLGRMQGYG